MKIVIHSIREYILYMIALNGELSIKEFTQNSTYSQRWIRSNISDLIKEGYIKKHLYKDPTQTISENETLRLRNPKGTDAVQEISEELLHQYELMTGGKAGERYKGTAARRERLRNEFYLSQKLAETGIEVSMLPYEYTAINNSPWVKEKRNQILEEERNAAENYYMSNHTIYNRDGTVIPLNEFKFRLRKETVNYFSIKILGNLRNTEQDRQNIFSRMFGFMLKDTRLIVVYMIYSSNPVWHLNAERKTILKLKKELFAVASPEFNQKEKGIFYFNHTKTYIEFLSPANLEAKGADKMRKNYMRPTDILSHGYLIPLTENHIALRELLLIANGPEKLSQYILQDNYEPDKEYDGTVNGIHVYNMLSSDMRKLNMLKKEVSEKSCMVLIHPWQKEGVQVYCGRNDHLHFVEVPAEQFENYIQELIYVESKNKN